MLCISTSKSTLAHAFAWSKTFKNTLVGIARGMQSHVARWLIWLVGEELGDLDRDDIDA